VSALWAAPLRAGSSILAYPEGFAALAADPNSNDPGGQHRIKTTLSLSLRQPSRGLGRWRS
jgi:hypothetical protein